MKDGIWFLIFVAAAAAAIYAAHLWNKNKNAQKLMEFIEKQWGKEPSRKYKAEDMESISGYFKYKGLKGRSVDDITWNDLDMDRVYKRINSAMSTAGEECLYSILRAPLSDEGELLERDGMISFFQKEKEHRVKIQKLLAVLGKVNGLNLHYYFLGSSDVHLKGGRSYAVQALMPFLALLLFPFASKLAVLMVIISVPLNIITYYKVKNEIDAELDALIYMVGLLKVSKRIAELGISGIGELNKKIKKSYKILKPLVGKLSFLVTKVQDPLMLIELLKIIFLADVVAFQAIFKTFMKHKEELRKIYDAVGLVDSMIALASYRESLDYYCVPVLKKASGKGEVFLNCNQIYHPLIKDPVSNSLETHDSVLITGSNASGKSTFIRTVAVNAILAQTIYTCTALDYSSSFFTIMSSMALKDNLQNNESYYIVEIKSLKRIIDSLNEDMPCLCFIDEVLRGTNTVERIAASSRILKFLSRSNCLCIAATHDIELTAILTPNFTNYHFQESFTDNDIIFDYRLYTGKSNTRNAIKLLGFLGYSEEITGSAEKMAESFLKNGIWSDV